MLVVEKVRICKIEYHFTSPVLTLRREVTSRSVNRKLSHHKLLKSGTCVGCITYPLGIRDVLSFWP